MYLHAAKSITILFIYIANNFGVVTDDCYSDWKKSVVEPEMEFDDVSTDIALSQGELKLLICCLLSSVYVKVTIVICHRAGDCANCHS